jgi:Winged helix DNA-binding domain
VVEQQHPVIIQCPVQPGLPALRPLSPGSGPALQEQQPRQVGVRLVGGDDLAGEHLDLLCVRPAVVERNGEEVIGQHGAWLAVAHHGSDGTAGRVGAMGRITRKVGVAERRARLAVRHHLAAGERAATVTAAAADIVGLHGTDPASVYLAARARSRDVDKAAIEQALYEERSLVRMLGMRRTVFVVPAALVPVIQSACTDQVAERMRRQLAQRVQESGIAADADGWLSEVGEATVRALAARGSATGAELARDEPRLRAQIFYATDKGYGGPVNLTTRLLTLLSAEGLIVRGRPRGGWTSGQFEWSVAGDRTRPPAAAARAELAHRWLRAFGPALVSDLQWWTGWTAGQVKHALGQLDVTEADLDGAPGIMLTADEPGRDPAAEPWAALLPALDPTAMGWRERAWYVGEHGPALFDRSGNIGPTVWWDGRIVGGWAQRQDGEIAVRLLEDTGAEAATAIAAEAQRLREWIGSGPSGPSHPRTRITPRFRTPLERELAG